MECLQSILLEIGKVLWAPLGRRVNYVKNFEKNFEKLNQVAQVIYTIRTDIEGEIERNRVLKKPTNQCNAWRENVGEIENKVKEITEGFNENKKCLGDWCPNVWWRMKLGKRIVIMIDNIAKCKEESKFVCGVLVDAWPRVVEPKPGPIIEAETSSGCIVQNILGCLENGEIGKIGVWGMGGVGKTTVLRNVEKSQKLIQMFDIVIWVTASKDCSVEKVQKDIADRLSLKLEENESEDRVSRKLLQKLETMKYLLLLDDVWNEVNLDDVGVPRPTTENGCKIVLTSRFLDMCRKMETDIDIKVEVLSEKQAWELFHKKVGDIVISPKINESARKVVKECCGLPLLLVVIGRSLRKEEDDRAWNNALTELRKATFDIGDDMEEKVFLRLKFSYDKLKDNIVKNCFLYCALYPEDFEIPVPELIDHWWVEGFIDEKKLKLKFDEIHDKGHVLLNNLRDTCLLEKIENDHQVVKVKMHDVIRDMALKITSPGGESSSKFVVKAGATAPLDWEDWEQAHKLSLMDTDLSVLPESPKCILLTTLLLQDNYKLKKMPKSFFEHMHKLQVLNLSNTGINELPSSLLNLANLRGLYLCGCRYLHTLPSGVGQLTSLEVLHVGSAIRHLPIEVGQLTRLRSLRVRFLNELSKTFLIPDGLLKRLTLLVDLELLVDPETFVTTPINYTTAVMKELVSLEKLICLRFHFPELKNLESFIQNCHWNERCFKSFWFFVGEHFSLSSPACLNFQHLGTGLMLKDNENYKKLSDLRSMEKKNALQFLYVSSFKAIERLIDGDGLPNLEILSIEMLPELRNIWERSVPPKSVSWLKELKIEHCRKLSNIFSSWGIIQHLSNLEMLWVIECVEIGEIVNVEEEEEEDVATVVNNEEDVAVIRFPRLKELHLLDLPKLGRICKGVPNPNPIAWPSLKELQILKCGNLKKCPLSRSRAPVLNKLVFDEAAELEYEDDAIKELVSYHQEPATYLQDSAHFEDLVEIPQFRRPARRLRRPARR